MNVGPGMIIDVLAAAMMLLSLIFGARRGFARTLFSFMQWFVCIIAGFFLCAPAKELLITQTSLDEAIHTYFIDQIETTIENSTPYQSIPDLFSQWVQEESEAFLYGSSSALTDVVLTVLTFVLMVSFIKLICGLLVLLFSKAHHEGLIGFIDGFAGFLFGGVRGILLVLLLFTVFVPLLCLLPADISAPVKTALDQSFLASFLYDENLLLILLRDLFS